mgnify:CR=1 FL=1
MYEHPSTAHGARLMILTSVVIVAGIFAVACTSASADTVAYGKTNLMIKQDHLKYQYYGSKVPEVLFNLKIDPTERRNFIDHPDYINVIQQFRKSGLC